MRKSDLRKIKYKDPTRKQKVDVFFLTLKYWCQGDEWGEAKEFAKSIVFGWKSRTL